MGKSGIKSSDKSFITPTEPSQYFNQIYNHTIEELQNSKARLVDDLSKQIDARYQIQIKNLNEQIATNKTLHEQQFQLANEQIDEFKTRLQKSNQWQL